MPKLGDPPALGTASDPTAALASKLEAVFQALVTRSKTIDTHVASLLAIAAEEKWSTVDPTIFGTLFQSLMKPSARHVRGTHYTPSKAILDHIIRPTLLEPWRARIHRVGTWNELLYVRESLSKLRILDPACGSGNFLYEAHCALRDLDGEISKLARERFSSSSHHELDAVGSISTRQLFGIDIDPLAVELAKITLLLGQKLAGDEISNAFAHLDDNIRCADALFCDWPKVDFIVGNPPFQSKNRMQQEFGPEYVQRLRQKYPDVPGRADYCVYWFRRVHDELAPGASAGLVGTNTIRQNYSREGGLDYIVKHGGTITEAVSTMVWPSEAIVHVSVVNWTKGFVGGPKKLSWQDGDDLDGPWHETRLATIPASLSPEVDVTEAKTLRANADSYTCFQGQTHGHEGFLLSPDEALSVLAASDKNKDVVFPYLNGDDLVSNLHGKPSRWVIDFSRREQVEAQRYTHLFQRIKERVLPVRETAARNEKSRNENLDKQGNTHHAGFLKRWWLLSYPRGELMTRLATINRYVVCSRVTKRPIFDFVSSRIHPSDALMVFPFEDDYSFGILQSALHWAWFTARCSTLTARFRYTSETVFDSFPWPQSPTEEQCLAVAKAGVALRALRRQIGDEHQVNLRAMYTSSKDSLKDAHAVLDQAVRAAYAMPTGTDSLAFLLELNQMCAAKESRGDVISGPGLPRNMSPEAFITRDCIEPPLV